MTKIKIAVVLVLLVIALIVVFQNRESVDTQLLFMTVTMPRAALLLVSLIIGFVGGLLTHWILVSRSEKGPKDAS